MCISITKFVVTVGKGVCRLSSGWFLQTWKQTRCSSSTGAIGSAVQTVFKMGERKWSLSKKQGKENEN